MSLGLVYFCSVGLKKKRLFFSFFNLKRAYNFVPRTKARFPHLELAITHPYADL
jgi:hypothetical protein